MKRGVTLFLMVGFFAGVAYLVLSAFVLPYVEACASVRVLDIPRTEIGYRTFPATVIHSEKEWQEFLRRLKTTDLVFLRRAKDDPVWKRWLTFEEQIQQVKLDFTKEALVLIPHPEGSITTMVGFAIQALRSKKLTCAIWRQEPHGLSVPATAYYCFALAVKKSTVERLEVCGGHRGPVVLAISQEAERVR